MASAAPLDASDAVADVVSQISSLWPDFAFSKEQLIQGDPVFVVRFFECFIDCIHEKLSEFLCLEELPILPSQHISDHFHPKIVLYCKAYKHFQKLNCSGGFCLMSFFSTSGKKMFTCVRVAAHFLFFVCNCTELKEIIHSVVNKKLRLEALSREKEEATVRMAKRAEYVAHLQEKLAKAKEKLKAVNEQHRKMQEEKLKREQVNAKKYARVKKLREEVENLEFQAKILENKDQVLKDSIVPQEEFEDLKNTQLCLKAELQKLETVDTSHGSNSFSVVKNLEQGLKLLSTMELDTKDVQSFEELQGAVADNSATLNSLSVQLLTTNQKIALEKPKIADAEKKLIDLRKESQRVAKECFTKEQEQASLLACEREKRKVAFEEYTKLVSEIQANEEFIEEMNNTKIMFEATASEAYEKTLNAYSQMAEKALSSMEQIRDELNKLPDQYLVVFYFIINNLIFLMERCGCIVKYVWLPIFNIEILQLYQDQYF